MRRVKASKYVKEYYCTFGNTAAIPADIVTTTAADSARNVSTCIAADTTLPTVAHAALGAGAVACAA